MENHDIPDSKITASSQRNSNHAGHQARLHHAGAAGESGSWSPRTNTANQWLQIDLGSQKNKLTAIASQGGANYDEWVTEYKLQYSNNSVDFQYYKEPGQVEAKVCQRKIKPSISLLFQWACFPSKKRLSALKPSPCCSNVANLHPFNNPFFRSLLQTLTATQLFTMNYLWQSEQDTSALDQQNGIIIYP